MLKAELDAAVAEVVDSQYFILGPNVEKFERACASYCNTEHGIGVSSGTDAIIVALMAMGIGEGSEVITTPYTFFSTAGSIVRLGAKPVFADIEPHSFNIDAKQIEAVVTRNTRAIMPVHLFGQMADMDAIQTIADANDILVVEDSSQAIGSKQKDQPACSLGHIGTLSFFPSKNLGGFGDGGHHCMDLSISFLRRLLLVTSRPRYSDTSNWNSPCRSWWYSCSLISKNNSPPLCSAR